MDEIRKMDYVRKVHLRKMFDYNKYITEMDEVYNVLVDETKLEATYSFHDAPFFTELDLYDIERETFNMYQAYRISTRYGEVMLYEDWTRDRLCKNIGYSGNQVKNILEDVNGTHYLMIDSGLYYIVEVDRLNDVKAEWLYVGTNLNDILFKKIKLI